MSSSASTSSAFDPKEAVLYIESRLRAILQAINRSNDPDKTRWLQEGLKAEHVTIKTLNIRVISI